MAQYGKSMQAERKNLEADGYESDYILRLQPKRYWLRANGTPIGLLPIDPYHHQRFSERGWHVAPPDWQPEVVEQKAPVPPWAKQEA